jgi:malonate decarboxylase beta subunit
MLSTRLARFGGCEDALDIWRLLGAPDPEAIPLSPTHELVAMAAGRRIS